MEFITFQFFFWGLICLALIIIHVNLSLFAQSTFTTFLSFDVYAEGKRKLEWLDLLLFLFDRIKGQEF